MATWIVNLGKNGVIGTLNITNPFWHIYKTHKLNNVEIMRFILLLDDNKSLDYFEQHNNQIIVVNPITLIY